MSNWAFTTGRLTRVLHPVGKFYNGDARYRRAQYDLLHWDSDSDGVEESYVLVPPADKQTGSQESIQSAIQEHEVGAEYGFYQDDAFITDVRGWHDVDSWEYLHVFGFV